MKWLILPLLVIVTGVAGATMHYNAAPGSIWFIAGNEIAGENLLFTPIAEGDSVVVMFSASTGTVKRGAEEVPFTGEIAVRRTVHVPVFATVSDTTEKIAEFERAAIRILFSTASIQEKNALANEAAGLFSQVIKGPVVVTEGSVSFKVLDGIPMTVTRIDRGGTSKGPVTLSSLEEGARKWCMDTVNHVPSGHACFITIRDGRPSPILVKAPITRELQEEIECLQCGALDPLEAVILPHSVAEQIANPIDLE